MASIKLRTLWLNSAADPSDRMAFPLMSSLEVDLEVGVRDETMANGRIIAVRRKGRRRPISATLPNCTREQIAWLEAHVGELVMARDDRGRKVWGFYRNMPTKEHSYNDEGSLAIALSEVTVQEWAA